MTREEKAQIIDEITEKLKASGFFYIADASAMTVAQINDFRRKCFEGGIEYKVYKNTLIQKALVNAEMASDELSATLKGTSGIMFSDENKANVPAKILKAYRSAAGGDKPSLKAAYIDSSVYVGDNNIAALSNLKTKTELIGEIITLLQSPAKNVISSLQSGGSQLSGILQTLSDKAE